ncbi:unnamed protein product [Aphanomyces euteiches]
MLHKFLLLALGASYATAKISPSLSRRLEVNPAARPNIVVSFHQSQTESTTGIESVGNLESLSKPARAEFVRDTLQKQATESHAGLLQLLTPQIESTTSDISFESFYIDQKVYIENATPEILAQIQKLPNVKSIDEQVTFYLEPLLPSSSSSSSSASSSRIESVESTLPTEVWGIPKIEVPAVWKTGNTGQGIVVANIDTGVLGTHEALKNNWRRDYGWFDPTYNTTVPTDSQGHGTMTMGVVAGAVNGIGVAPGAQWIACVGCDAQGNCPQVVITRCAQWLLCPTDSTGKSDCSKAPHIISNSYNTEKTDALDDVIKAWRAAGIVPVFSNGNKGSARGCGVSSYPGSSLGAIAVGGSNDHDELSYFNSLGPAPDGRIKPDLLAPGSSIVSSSRSGNDTYDYSDGSSLAAPHVAGAVALYLHANPKATFDQIYAALTKSTVSDTLTMYTNTCGNISATTFPNNGYGYGRLNVRAALGLPDTTGACYALEKDTEYIGNDFANTSRASAALCCADCAATPGCELFTWKNENGGTCYLKNAKGLGSFGDGSISSILKANRPPTPSTPAPTPATTRTPPPFPTNIPTVTPSATKATTAAPATTIKPTTTKKPTAAPTTAKPAETCQSIQNNVDYVGFDLKSTSQSSANACCADCAATPGCKLFVWTDFAGGTCWLKHTVGVKSTQSGAKAGLLPTKSSSSSCGAQKINVDYPGNDVGATQRATPDLCCDDCKTTTVCHQYVWTNFQGGTCWLKSAKGKAKPNDGAVAASLA